MNEVNTVISELRHVVKMYKIAKCRQFPIQKAIKLFEKQTPKKPIKYSLVNGNVSHDCTCGHRLFITSENWIESTTKYSYCPNCGQAIDWTD